MAESGAENELLLVGALIGAPQMRYSPAGIPIARLWLEHRSAQTEGERSRAVAFRVEIRATGRTLCQGLTALEPGQALRVRGHLARADQRGEPGRLVIVAEDIDLL